MLSRMTRFPIFLAEDELNALSGLAYVERRDIRDQAALLIRQALEARNLLPPRDALPQLVPPPPAQRHQEAARAN